MFSYAQKANNKSQNILDSTVDKLSAKSFAFDGIDTINFDPNVDLAEQLMPIDSLLAYAGSHSSSIKLVAAEVDRFKYNTKYISTIWLNGIGLFYNYTYGSQFNSLASSQNPDQQLSNNLGIGYRYGVNMSFLLGEIYGRKNRLKSLRAEIEMAKQKKEESLIALKRNIIADYYNLISNQRLVKIKQADAESATLTAAIAEYEMRRGKIMPSELSRLKNVQSIADVNLELSKRDYATIYLQFETLMGCKLSNFKKKR